MRTAIATVRNAVEARVLVTWRIRPLTVHGRVTHQTGLPLPWGTNGVAIGDAANELVAMSLDPDVRIQEDKAMTTDLVTGRMPRGADLPRPAEEYRVRAGITDDTGTETVK